MSATATLPATAPAAPQATTGGFPYRQRPFARTDTAGMVEALHRDGFALIPGVLSPEEVVQARAEIDRLHFFHWDSRRVAKNPDGTPGNPVDHWKCVFNRSPYWLRYLDTPGVIELAEGTMGEECHSIGMTCWRTHPQGPPAPGTPYLDPNGIHSDHLMFPVKEELLVSGQVQVPIMLCTAHYYLSDIDLELCPTWVVPGSHLSGRWAQQVAPEERVRFRGQEAQPVLVRAGDVLFFRSEIWHTGSRNRTTDRIRYLLQVHYGNRYVAQKFSPYLDFRFNHEVVAQATPRQRRLLGDHRRAAYD